MDYFLEINTVTILKNTMCIVANGRIFGCSELCKPKLILHFVSDREDRFIPMVLQSIDKENSICSFSGVYRYKLDNIFWETQGLSQEFTLSFDLMADGEIADNVRAVIYKDHILFNSENYTAEKKDPTSIWFRYTKPQIKKSKIGKLKKIAKSLTGTNNIETDDFSKENTVIRKQRYSAIKTIFIRLRTGLKRAYIIFWYEHYKQKPVTSGQLAFISQRSTVLTDNMEFVYNDISKDKTVKCVFYLSTTPFQETSLAGLRKFAKIAASSKVILIDEYVPALYFLSIRSETKFVQIWHACGAFKTVGFSRIGKLDAPKQAGKAHRNYDLAVVSSSNVRRWYAEAFGLPLRKVVSPGVPRTDIFFNDSYKEHIRTEFFNKYPQTAGKKIILFAPTFRGTIKNDGYYPFEKADLAKIIDKAGDEYVILLRHHPFVTEKHPFPAEYSNRIIDVCDYPSVNDLLFVTDLLITDYSSVIFEASLLDIPMLFYAFDMEEYIMERDFYFSYENFVPGKIVVTCEELSQAIADKDFEHEKVKPFSEAFFDIRDGKATQRVTEILKRFLA